MDRGEKIRRRFKLEDARNQARAHRIADKLADKLLDRLASGKVSRDGNRVTVVMHARMGPKTMERVKKLLMPAVQEKLPPCRRIITFTYSSMRDETWDIATGLQCLVCLLGAWPVFFFRLLRVHVEVDTMLVAE